MTNPPWLHIARAAPQSAAARVNGASCRTRTGLFTEWARALAFPDYFGHNWDAFADALRDVPVEGAAEVAVLDAPALLADEPPTQLRTLLDVLGEAADRSGLRVILVCPPGEEAALVERLAG